jgi:hypothetical protein
MNLTKADAEFANPSYIKKALIAPNVHTKKVSDIKILLSTKYNPNSNHHGRSCDVNFSVLLASSKYLISTIGICSMCGRKILDTSGYKQSSK